MSAFSALLGSLNSGPKVARSLYDNDQRGLPPLVIVVFARIPQASRAETRKDHGRFLRNLSPAVLTYDNRVAAH